MNEKDHWEAVYQQKAPDQVSWYRPHLDRSLEFIEAAGLARNAAIIDVGGGASTFVDDLLDRGYSDVTVLDISATAIETAKARLGARARQVTWIIADVTGPGLPEDRYDFWHDRAVFHFLKEEAARERYVQGVKRSVKVAGHVVVATFGHGGPEKCSGLDVMRYDADEIHSEFGGSFRKVASATDIHVTPWGSEQEFVYCYCRMGE